MQNILVTGATGFIGRPLCARLLAEIGGTTVVRGLEGLRVGGGGAAGLVRGAVWRDETATGLSEGIETVLINSIGPDTDWSRALAGIDTVIHLAARVHVMDEAGQRLGGEGPLEAYRRVNVAGTEKLVRMAATVGVKRLVFLSSVKVHGEETATRYTEQDLPSPLDPYGVSKLEAEEIMRKIAGETGLEVVIIRPPLVYGPGVKANFYRLMGIVARGVPLPFGSIDNARSLIYLGNLIDAIVLCSTHPLAAGRTFLIRDGEDLSTPELIRRIAVALGQPARLFPFPLGLMRSAGKLTGRGSAIDRLLGSLAVDDSKIRTELGWEPPFTITDGLKKTAEWYIRDVALRNDVGAKGQV